MSYYPKQVTQKARSPAAGGAQNLGATKIRRESRDGNGNYGLISRFIPIYPSHHIHSS